MNAKDKIQGVNNERDEEEKDVSFNKNKQRKNSQEMCIQTGKKNIYIIKKVK